MSALLLVTNFVFSDVWVRLTTIMCNSRSKTQSGLYKLTLKKNCVEDLQAVVIFEDSICERVRLGIFKFQAGF